MPNDNTDLKKQLDALRRENEALRRENEKVRAERKAALDAAFAAAGVHIPSEEEMAAQLPTVVPFSVVMQDVDRILSGEEK
jgi:hypothetical protein